MDREEEIEKIAKVMCGGCPDNKECMHGLCADWYKAESIYNAGYRHQRDVAIDIFDDIETTFSVLLKGDISEIEKLLSVVRKKYTERN